MIRVNAFRRYMETNNFARVTILTRMSPLRLFDSYLKRQGIKEVDKDVIQRYLNYLKKRGYKDGSLKSKRDVLRSYYQYAVLVGDCKTNPTTDIVVARNEIRRELAYSLGETK